ncbi:hypothetical protein NPL7_00280 [Metamycoplasma hyosynoviae]|uniref:Uncharacterized protein n=1 Tax=Metamycoplasma hyosynoviae TaxID=29559 RepID=A0A063YH51_9BACT|nr:hypothetical protein [Metamycoplasma hyosynoviae]ASI54127.1 hypothetical protein MHSN_03035 [Metamycoplasma hyosynoviae]KDE42032.1 hypothetical protein NPL3_02435 [Metamycoplasma hyosynoviae]KDE42479.1 hypothetical protein NPL7_00280 [Metamycoplasma hyosynoviae]KDE43103.1 hypothetical protein NPL5_03120 [Metamycoplasma hyosynoviae]KDE44099.1 hypothetical protein NPL2_03720 [Metamycoplasma hyosynoviae]
MSGQKAHFFVEKSSNFSTTFSKVSQIFLKFLLLKQVYIMLIYGGDFEMKIQNNKAENMT